MEVVVPFYHCLIVWQAVKLARLLLHQSVYGIPYTNKNKWRVSRGWYHWEWEKKPDRAIKYEEKISLTARNAWLSTIQWGTFSLCMIYTYLPAVGPTKLVKTFIIELSKLAFTCPYILLGALSRGEKKYNCINYLYMI